ncbi:MAG TPA: FtsX-like permease family protein [Chitinophagaceae bacterium]|nr:FtsX-like permease family protein [Chitinophagaceae bacterium]
MIQFIKLAWRNLWRNRRRTLITLTSVLMAVVLAIAIRSVQLGAYGNMIGNAVRFSTGYIQVHQNGYWNDQSINNIMEWDSAVTDALRKDNNISLAIPRLESFALASSGAHTKGVAVVGIDPEKENQMTGLKAKISGGSYFTNSSGEGALVGDGLAKYLQLHPGDTIVLLGQGYHGTTAAGQFLVQGIFHYPVEQLNNAMVYLSIGDAQTLFAAPERITSVSLMLRDPKKMNSNTKELQKKLGKNYEVMDWPSMNKSLVEEIKGDNAGGIIMLGILYLVVAFGVFGTILMMTMERKKEFSVMIAIGMHRAKLTMIMIFETIFIGLMGIITGCLLILPVIIYLYHHPIRITGKGADAYQQFGIEPLLPASLDPSIFLYQGLTVLAIAIVSVVYPLWYVNRFPLAETLKQ